MTIGSRIVRSAVALGVALAAIIAAAAPALAHVTIQPASVRAGSTDVQLTFRCPNEMDNARTVELQAFFPSNLPLLTVDVLPITGWSEHITEVHLRKPVQTDDGLVSQVVSEVDWTAVRGGGITPGHYEDFDVLVGAMPTTPGQVVLKALQTYSNGQIVRWIQLAVPGEPAPDTPAPILTLTRGVAVAASATGSTGTPTPNSAGGNGNGGGSGDAGTIALVAVIVAIGALVAAVVALLRGRNQSGPDPAAGPSEDDDSGTSGNDAPDAGAD